MRALLLFIRFKRLVCPKYFMQQKRWQHGRHLLLYLVWQSDGRGLAGAARKYASS